MQWQWYRFRELSIDQLYEILRARQQVFTVEQHCPYQDADGKDQFAWHLTCWSTNHKTPQLMAYLRVLFPGRKYREPAIGRVLTTEPSRGAGLGKALMDRAVQHTLSEYPKTAIRISAQQHLSRFYTGFGFEQVSPPYEEDGIPHIEMLRPAP
ncbi:GNAT family N-acetyltransferase [Microbulbifer spongiae]|uniref:GNAT family N-acetyltransferase n=1 Tax=Microbulbifer spongiae TaxID=2944933 RepID=A0ABY9EHI8_9GAMM|nr:GNAT family N-acetyltransferase [Microbulbifer sp. MI-G]WKD51194.1 GNAT family N-acetyltransferase [Microbulbifer sp. MI-G]